MKTMYDVMNDEYGNDLIDYNCYEQAEQRILSSGEDILKNELKDQYDDEVERRLNKTVYIEFFKDDFSYTEKEILEAFDENLDKYFDQWLEVEGYIEVVDDYIINYDDACRLIEKEIEEAKEDFDAFIEKRRKIRNGELV